MPSGQTDRRDALPSGATLRGYTVEAALGHGGFGIVYRARHNELGHLVAIKEYLPAELAVREGNTVAPRSADCEEHFANGLRRFRDEAKALIDLRGHPNIVECRDFFRDNGTAYLVMDFVDGQPLSEVLRRREAAGRPFEEADLLAVAVPLAEGLGHVHRAGLLHRDIKPANILIRRTDERPVLIDFGAAKQSVAEHTRSLAPYTEGYAALEQVAEGQLGPWTDMYGLGALLWRIVAGGNLPWAPPDPIKVEKRASASLGGRPDPLPTARRLGSGRFSVPLLKAIDGCLALKDGARTQSSEALLAILRTGVETAPVEGAVASKSKLRSFMIGSWMTGLLQAPPRSVGRHLRSALAVAGIVGLAAISAVLMVSAVRMFMFLSSPPLFSVEPSPSSASVVLLGDRGPYWRNMPLAAGRYEVVVSAPGYEATRVWLKHSASMRSHRIVLKRAFPEASAPSPRPVHSSHGDVPSQGQRSAKTAHSDAQGRLPGPRRVKGVPGLTWDLIGETDHYGVPRVQTVAEREREEAAAALRRRRKLINSFLSGEGYGAEALIDPRYIRQAGESAEVVRETLGSVGAGALEASALAAQTASDTFRQIFGP